MFNKKKEKHYAIFCIKQHGVFKRISRKRVNPLDKFVRKGKNTFTFEVGFPTYRRGLKIFYFIDIEKGQLVSKNAKIIKKVKEGKVIDVHVLFTDEGRQLLMSPKTLDRLISQKIVGQLTSNLSDNAWKMSVMSIILGVIIGALAGFITAGYV